MGGDQEHAVRSILLLAVATMGVTPSFAYADEFGVRAGLGVGLASIDFERSFEARDTAWSAFAVYDFNRYFSMEAAYVDGGSPHDVGVSVDVSHADVMAIGSWPIGRWSISARVGATAWAWESVGVKREGTDLAYGVGTAVEWTRMQVRLIADTAEIDDARLMHVSLQTSWKF